MLRLCVRTYVTTTVASVFEGGGGVEEAIDAIHLNLDNAMGHCFGVHQEPWCDPDVCPYVLGSRVAQTREPTFVDCKAEKAEYLQRVRYYLSRENLGKLIHPVLQLLTTNANESFNGHMARFAAKNCYMKSMNYFSMLMFVTVLFYLTSRTLLGSI